jgi:hypothetical protein
VVPQESPPAEIEVGRGLLSPHNKQCEAKGGV